MRRPKPGLLVRGAALPATAAASAAAYLFVGGLPGTMYAAGLFLLGLVAATQIRSRGASPDPAGRRRRWRKSLVIAELGAELAVTESALAEHRSKAAALEVELQRETEAARTTQASLEDRIEALEEERRRIDALLEEERARFERSLEELTGGIGVRGRELEALERQLAAMIDA